MVDYKYLDNGVEVAYYSDGSYIAGNFTDKDVYFNDKKITPFGYVLG